MSATKPTRLQWLIAAVVFFLVYSVPVWVIGGFTAMRLWNWFIATTFHGVILTLPQAMGVVLVSRVAAGWSRRVPKPEGESQAVEYLLPFTYYAFALAMGYVLHRWFL